jgi:hypothetical protein
MKLLKLAKSTVNLQADRAAALFDGGRIEIHVGIQPEGPDLDFLPRTPVAVFQLPTPAFAKAKDGKINLYPLSLAIVKNGGTPTWGRALSADGRALMDFSIGDHAFTHNMVLDKSSVRDGDHIGIVSFSHTVATSSPGC